MAGLRGGDPSSFDEAYDSYRPRLFSFLVRLSGEPHLAEDLLQETFMKLARHARELRQDTRLAAWLFTVARNLLLSHKRWALLDLGKATELRMWSRLRRSDQGHSSPFALAAASETERILEQALAALPLRHREVILLVAVEGMTPSEAARVLGMHATAVRQRLSRARGMLQAYLSRAQREP